MSRKKWFGYRVNDALELAGLQRRGTILGWLLPAIGLLVGGAAIGAGIGLAFAPSSGQRLRQGVGAKLDQLRSHAKGARRDVDTLSANATPH